MGIFIFQKLSALSGPSKLNLVCFHWAGGTGIAFKSMAKSFEAAGICCYAVTLPGRNGRGTATMFRNMADILQSLVPEFVSFHKENNLGDQPLLFFGHSFGGLLAFELYKSITSNCDAQIIVEKIIVSAVRCPSDLTDKNKDPSLIRHHKQSNRELTDYMHSIGGKNFL